MSETSANHYRHELKYAIGYGEYMAMRARLKCVMRSDPHTKDDGRYRIKSIYFDNLDDNILKYMAVHTFAVNMDSLSGSMAHNYYLYDSDGKLDMFPWDYNLSFGGMSMGQDADATEMVNDAIDTPFAGTEFFDVLLENGEYLEQYHSYLKQLTEEYVEGGRFEQTYNRFRYQIDELVRDDPTAFYTYDEYEKAAKLLYETVQLRAESINGQLDGSIPSTDEDQKKDTSSFVDASHIDVKAMGEFNMGGAAGGKGGDDKEQSFFKRDKKMPDMGSMPGQPSAQTNRKNVIAISACFVIMLAALIAMTRFRRRRR